MSRTTVRLADAHTHPGPYETLVDAIDELTTDRPRHVWLDYYDKRQHRRVRRRIDIGRYSLIALLELDVARDDDTALKQTSSTASPGFASRPPGHYPPRELLAGFTRDISIWLGSLGLDETSDQAHNLERIRDLAPTLKDHAASVDRYAEELEALARRMEYWATQLRQYVGLELTYQPRATCPECLALGKLTIWIDVKRRRPERARCAHCRTNWDQIAVDRLIYHVRREADTKVA